MHLLEFAKSVACLSFAHFFPRGLAGSRDIGSMGAKGWGGRDEAWEKAGQVGSSRGCRKVEYFIIIIIIIITSI